MWRFASDGLEHRQGSAAFALTATRGPPCAATGAGMERIEGLPRMGYWEQRDLLESGGRGEGADMSRLGIWGALVIAVPAGAMFWASIILSVW